MIIEKNPFYGYRRLKTALKDKFKLTLNHKLILKLLKLWGLELKRKVQRPKKSWVVKVLNFLQLRANLLWLIRKTSTLIQPFRVLVTDITEISYQHGKAYLCVYLDYAGKMIYGYHLSRNGDTDLVLNALKKGLVKIRRILGKPPENLIVHQDRGSVYTSSDYVSKVFANNLRLSYSRKGEPGDNAVNESFFSRFKDEWRDVLFEAKNFRQLENLVKKAIRYYNYTRYHSTLGNIVPAKFVKNRLDNLTTQVVS